MTEKATDFARRLGTEIGNFTSSKTQELAGRVRGGAYRYLSMAEEKTYRAALTVVARRFELTTEEAESRLSTPVSVKRTSARKDTK